MSEAEVGRETLILLPAWAVVLFYTLTLASLMTCCYGVLRIIRRYRRGRRPAGTRLRPGAVASAVWRAVRNTTVLRHDRFAGIAHFMVMWGFFVLFLGTLVVLVDRDILRFALPGWVFWKGKFYVAFSLLTDISGVMLVLGALMLAVRRAAFRLPQLDARHAFRETDIAATRRSEWLLLGLVLFIVFSGFLLEGARLHMHRPWYEAWSFAGGVFADDLDRIGTTSSGAASVYPTIWWLHSLASLAFVAWFPFSKGLHMVLGIVTLAMKDELRMRRLPPAVSDEHAGYRHITDLAWDELLALDACVRCGRCHANCPSRLAGLPLSPRDVLRELRDYARLGGSNGHVLAGELLPRDTLWSCITCGICSERCPLGIDHVPLMVQLRRTLVEEGEVDEQLQQTLINLQRNGNAMGQSDRQRARWTRELPFSIPDARKEKVEYLWYVGDNASYDPRVQDVTRTVATLLHEAGVNYGILYEGERNAGNDVRRVGEEGLYDMLAEHNLRTLARAQYDTVITTDPHTLNTLRHEYDLNGVRPRILHYTELLRDLVREQRLQADLLVGLRVTYHDPCYLARYNGIIDAPRELLRMIGVELVEMSRHGKDAYCCGAGGGRLWMEDIEASGERPAESRLREAASLPGVGTIVTACPKDIVMFQDAIKTTGFEGRFFVRDIAEIVRLAVRSTVPLHQEKEN